MEHRSISPEKQDIGLHVRRSTDELEGEVTLERATIAAQQQLDDVERRLRQRRMRDLSDDPLRAPKDSIFYEIEGSALALQKTYRKFETDTAFSRRVPATAKMAFSVHDFESLTMFVRSLESQWERSLRQVHLRFRTVCQKLEDHKAAFGVFPAQNTYASILCGSLALFVGAAVNDKNIAENLSEMIVDLSDKATRAAKIVTLHPTENIRRLFSDLYAQVFLFYRDTITWYAKSKVTRVFDTFNANLTKPYKKAAARIESLLIEIYREAALAESAQTFEAALRFHGRQLTDTNDRMSALRQAQRLLRSTSNGAYPNHTTTHIHEEDTASRSADVKISDASRTDCLRREKLETTSEVLHRNVVGSDGRSMLGDVKSWLQEIDIAFKLSAWMSPDSLVSTLWVTSPVSSRGVPGSRAAALNALAAACKAEQTRHISHFCLRPHPGDLDKGRAAEKAGMIGLIYSLIIQLFRLKVKDDEFQIAKEQFAKLDGSDASWPVALKIFQDLLSATPMLNQCIIDGINHIACSDGAEWCDIFLRTLLRHQAQASDFKILFTTNGQPKLLLKHVHEDNIVYVQKAAREDVHGTTWLGTTCNGWNQVLTSVDMAVDPVDFMDRATAKALSQ